MDGNGAQERQQIRYGLGHLDAHQTKGGGQQKNRRDKEHALPRSSQERGRNRAVDGLLHHVTHDNPALGREAYALEPQGGSTALDDLRVIPEQANQIRGEGKHQGTDGNQEHQRGLDTEPESFLHPVIEIGSEVEAADRLEALAEANHGGCAKHHDALYHAHGGDGGIAKLSGGVTQANGGHRCQTLPGQRGKPALDNRLVVGPLEFDPGDADTQAVAFIDTDVQQAEADELADDGGPSGTGNLHFAYQNQQGVQGDVQYRTGHDAYHGVHGVALIAQLVVQHQRGGHPRRAQQNHPEVVLGVFQHGIGGAKQISQGLQENLTQDANQDAGRQGGIEAGGRHVGSFLIVLFAQLPGDKVAAAVAEEEANGLNDRHHGEHHAHRAGGGVAVEHAHEEGVGHVVEGGYQHADDAGDSQLADQLRDRRLGHLLKLQLMFVHFYHLVRSSFGVWIHGILG